MPSFERSLLRRIIRLYEIDARSRSRVQSAGDPAPETQPSPESESDIRFPSSIESALAILLATQGDVVVLGSTVYRRDGLSVIVYRDVPVLDASIDPEEAELGASYSDLGELSW